MVHRISSAVPETSLSYLIFIDVAHIKVLLNALISNKLILVNLEINKPYRPKTTETSVHLYTVHCTLSSALHETINCTTDYPAIGRRWDGTGEEGEREKLEASCRSERLKLRQHSPSRLSLPTRIEKR